MHSNLKTNTKVSGQSWKLERKKLSIANQTLAMILDLLSILSKDGVSLLTWINVTQIYPVIVPALHVRWFSLNETRLAYILSIYLQVHIDKYICYPPPFKENMPPTPASKAYLSIKFISKRLIDSLYPVVDNSLSAYNL